MKVKIIILLFVVFAGCKKESGEIELAYCIDFEGYKYKTVKIGNQWWMAENLRTKHYQNGDAILYFREFGSNIGKYCNYNDSTLNSKYGNLYNYYAVINNKNIAPTGWHIPSVAEWDTLITFLGGKVDYSNAHSLSDSIQAYANVMTIAGNKMKDNNGFYATFGGKLNNYGDILGINTYAKWWTSESEYVDSEFAIAKQLENDIYQNFDYKSAYLSIRCVKD